MHQAESNSRPELAGYLRQQAKEYANRAFNCGLVTVLLAAGYVGINELSKDQCVENQPDGESTTCARYVHATSPKAWDPDYTKLLFGFPAGVLVLTGISNGLNARRANILADQIESSSNTEPN
jgi:hypothetical protein